MPKDQGLSISKIKGGVRLRLLGKEKICDLKASEAKAIARTILRKAGYDATIWESY